jgi:hypothetical protein
MISLDQLNEEIMKLEASPVSFENCHRLVTLYALRERYSPQKSAWAARQSVQHESPDPGAEIKSNTIYIQDPSSEFLQIINRKENQKVWPVLDELLSTIKVINPRLYDGVLRKLEE